MSRALLSLLTAVWGVYMKCPRGFAIYLLPTQTWLEEITGPEAVGATFTAASFGKNSLQPASLPCSQMPPKRGGYRCLKQQQYVCSACKGNTRCCTTNGRSSAGGGGAMGWDGMGWDSVHSQY